MSVASSNPSNARACWGEGRAFHLKEREEDAVWTGGRNFCEDIRHVRVAFLNLG